MAYHPIHLKFLELRERSVAVHALLLSIEYFNVLTLAEKFSDRSLLLVTDLDSNCISHTEAIHKLQEIK